MPVFNTAANQQLSSPIRSYQQGKAVRLANQNAALVNERLEQEIDMADDMLALDQGNLETRQQELQMRVAEHTAKMDENQREGVARGATAALEVYDAGGSEEEATSAFATSLASSGLEMPEGGVADEASMRALIADDEDYRSLQKSNAQLTADEKLIDRLPISDEKKAELLEAIAAKKGTVTGTTEFDVVNFGGGAGEKNSDKLAREVIGATENLISSVDRISEQVDEMPQSAMGLPGKVSAIIDNSVNAVVGFADIAGGMAQINGQDVDERNLLDARLYQDMFSGPAAENAALQANSIGLAYALARSANPDGRISDADVRHQLERVKLDSSSKSQIKAAIQEVRRSVLSNVSNHLRVYGYTESKEGKAAYDKYMEELDKLAPDQGSQMPVVTSDEDYAALSVGDEFVDEDGVRYIKQ